LLFLGTSTEYLLFCALAISAYAQENHIVPDSFLHVNSVVPDGNESFVAPVLNTGTKTITAYSINRSSWSMALWCQCRLEPHQSSGIGTQPSWGVSGEDGTPVKVTAVIFEDDTALGDDKEIDKLFGFRRGEAAELRALQERIQALANSPTFSADLEQVLKARQISTVVKPEDNGSSGADSMVRGWLVQDDKPPKELFQMVTERLTAVDAHTTRKTQP